MEKTPIRKLLIVAIDQLKQGRGPLVAKTVAATVLVVFSSMLYSVMEIQKRSTEGGGVNPTDEVLMAQRLLEASLMGFSVFLSIMVDRLHYYIKELYLLRKEAEEAKRLNQGHDEGLRNLRMEDKVEGIAKSEQPESASKIQEKGRKVPSKIVQ
ncbi:hypothetical protein K2173_023765 [Erythroxylum novogranatense]|uniref:Endoplasmic reticulum transmembrane protein n=1 Tax=Erythroxylum novogranatense TaxID=1862640 RepID=A0AAV8TKP0_9ROSI|nr:hypothetical protein K2173_023765 [Erythroxylum novogranatense]